jgi:hypothetical protein
MASVLGENMLYESFGHDLKINIFNIVEVASLFDNHNVNKMFNNKLKIIMSQMIIKYFQFMWLLDSKCIT